MKKFSKLLSVALVVVMVFSLFVSSFALKSGETIGFILKADKTTAEIVPGAAVKVTMYVEVADFDQLYSDMKFALLYDANVYTPDTTTRKFLGDWANYAKDATTAKINAAFGTAVMNASSMTAEEKATYNSAVMLTIGSDAGLGATNKAGYHFTQDGTTGVSIAECSMVFNVTGDAAAIASGNINIKICDTVNTTQYIKKTNGTSTPTNHTSIDVSKANILANMPAAPASILNPYKSQIRFDKNADSTYAGTFDVRQLAVVSKADFESTFGATTAEQLAAIAEVGFVFARTSTVATFDVETAKALIESGTAAAGYTKKTVDYITTNAVVGTDNYGFSCIVEDIPTADKADGINALAYIKGNDGTYHYYPAAEPTSFNDLYTDWYNSAFPA